MRGASHLNAYAFHSLRKILLEIGTTKIPKYSSLELENDFVEDFLDTHLALQVSEEKSGNTHRRGDTFSAAIPYKHSRRWNLSPT